MPLELQIIRASEFIRMSPQGYLDLGASKEALAELVRACRKRGTNSAMVDLRALRPKPKPVFSPADLAALVSTFRENGFTRNDRLAVLYHSDPYRRARLFAFLSTMHGWNVQAFPDFEAALLWLSDSAQAEPRVRSPEGKQIPVRFKKPASSHPKPKPTLRRSQQRRTEGRKSTFSAGVSAGRLGKRRGRPPARGA